MAMYCVAVELGLTIHDTIEFVEKARPESNVLRISCGKLILNLFKIKTMFVLNICQNLS